MTDEAKQLMLCTVFRSEKKEGAYVYTATQAGGRELDELPEALLQALGPLTDVMRLKLTAQRKLANADASRVMQEITQNGYYLQMPPVPAPARAEENEHENTTGSETSDRQT